RVEPVHRRARTPSTARGVSRAATRPGRVARVRARPHRPDRIRRAALGRARAGADRVRGRAGDRSGPPHSHGSHPVVVRRRLLRRLGMADVVVTGAITERVLAARDRYPREASFYDDLRAQARRVFYLTPGAGLAGPWVAVYRLRA